MCLWHVQCPVGAVCSPHLTPRLRQEGVALWKRNWEGENTLAAAGMDWLCNSSKLFPVRPLRQTVQEAPMN